MNTNNLQQWWEATYRHHQLKNVFNPHDLKNGEATKLNLLQQIGSSDYGAAVNYTLKNYPNNENEENIISSITFIVMVILFGIVVFGGVLGNATLILTLCSASSIRLRNPLLIAVCLADLMVTGISAPMTILNVSLKQKNIALSINLCKIIRYVQIMPVAASTISFFMLSLDRYATVRHPCLARLRQRRYLHVSLALLSWILSAAISLPFLFSYRILAKSSISENGYNKQYLISSETSSGDSENAKMEANLHTNRISTNFRISCISEIDITIFIPFIIFHTFAVFIIPGFGVLLNHYGVRQKLCALSLTARAAHGELPLPMPILRRQTHMVIVTGIANAKQAGGCTTDDTSNEPDIQMHSLNPNSVVARGHNYVKTSNPISPRAMREIRAHSQRQRINRNQCATGPAAPGIPLPRTSTLHSRRRLANVLIASALIFIICWLPHVFCIFYTNSGYQHYCSNTSKYFHLLLGKFPYSYNTTI